MRAPVDSADLPDQSPHYTRSVAEMGEAREVIAQEDIYAANGMKLFAKGARINKSQCDRLSLHKLRVPLDLVLSTADPVDAARLAFEGNKMIANDPAMARLAERSGDPRGFRQCLSTLSLPTPLAFRMTVMHDERTSLFNHTLRVALITYSMAVRLRLSEREKHDVLLAALCHDLGEMHTDPTLLASGYRITPEERRFIHVHPITSYVVLSEMPGIPPATLQAVLHHHERLDGSGYPYGLNAEKIHPLAKLVCVAEVMEGVVRRFDLQRLDVLLRLNQRRFDPRVVNALRTLVQGDTNVSENDFAEPVEQDASVQLTHVAAVLSAWSTLQDRVLGSANPSSSMTFLTERMSMLRSLVLQAGINPDDVEALLEIAREDQSVLNELHATLNELDWLMVDVANEIERRSDSLPATSRAAVEELVTLLRTASSVESRVEQLIQ